MDSHQVTLIVIAKEPLPGRCKTRLTPPLEPAEAARLAEAALADTVERVAEVPARRRLLALDGRPPAWLPGCFDVVPQADGGLDARLAAAFDAAGGPALLVGMDTPQLRAEQLAAGASRLMTPGVDGVLGRAPDGGYWAIGLRRPDPQVFAGVPMSTAGTARAQRDRLAALGLRWEELDELRDFDTADDARAVAAECPGTRFASACAELGLARAPAPA